MKNCPFLQLTTTSSPLNCTQLRLRYVRNRNWNSLPLHCVAHCLGPDKTVLEYECVDAVVDLALGGIGRPLEKQGVIFIKFRFEVPVGLGYVREQFRKYAPDTRLTSKHPRGRHEEGVVAVVRHDAVDILGSQRLGMMCCGVRAGIGVLLPSLVPYGNQGFVTPESNEITPANTRFPTHCGRSHDAFGMTAWVTGRNPPHVLGG
jgi:hypothetical protein